MSASRVFTLLVLETGPRLLDGAGGLLLEGAACREPAALRAVLPRQAAVQVVFSGGRLAVHCQDAPALTPREQRDVARRLAREAGLPAGQEEAHVLEADPAAEGGHVLWLASAPGPDLGAWLDPLVAAGARPLLVLPWQRALLAAGPREADNALYLTLEGGVAQMVLFRGRSLRFARSFPLGGADPGAAFAEELALLMPFIRQKHRLAAPRQVFTVGLPEAPALEEAARALGLPLTPLAEGLPAFLRDGADRERRHRRRLDLLPAAIRDARSRAMFRAVVRASLLALVLGGAAAKAFLVRQERDLAREAAQAETVLAARRALARGAEEAARLRFGLLRVRRAEAWQREATERLERLGVRLFQAPVGVELEKVEILPAPGGQRFTVEGTARSGRGFALGALGAYRDHLKGIPGVELDPLRDVKILDAGDGRARVRFRLEGSAP